MELGALVCTPDRPALRRLPPGGPLRGARHGASRNRSRPGRPRRRPRSRSRRRPSWSAGVAARRCCWCSGPRPAAGPTCGSSRTGRWRGRDARPGRRPAPGRQLTGLEGRLGPELLTLRHGVTHYQITLVCFEAEYLGEEFQSAFYPQARWLTPAELASYPVSAPQRRLARALAGPARQPRLF